MGCAPGFAGGRTLAFADVLSRTVSKVALITVFDNAPYYIWTMMKAISEKKGDNGEQDIHRWVQPHDLVNECASVRQLSHFL